LWSSDGAVTSVAQPAALDPRSKVGRDRLRLELVGFWRLYNGGGRCLLHWDHHAEAWRGTVEDVVPSSPSHHPPTPCRFTNDRVTDFVRLGECQPLSATEWMVRYREPV